MSQRDKETISRWSGSAPYWEKHREVIREMFGPITEALTKDAQATTRTWNHASTPEFRVCPQNSFNRSAVLPLQRDLQKEHYEYCGNQRSEGTSRPICQSRGERGNNHCYGTGHTSSDARSAFRGSRGDRDVEAYGPNPRAWSKAARPPRQSQA